jgi:hypothetical protein
MGLPMDTIEAMMALALMEIVLSIFIVINSLLTIQVERFLFRILTPLGYSSTIAGDFSVSIH